MISSPEAREAFDINKEDDKIRDEYGRNDSRARDCCCARRLVEAGVRFVTTDLRRLGHARQHRTAASTAKCRRSIRLMRR